jgi:hypothetical protein
MTKYEELKQRIEGWGKDTTLKEINEIFCMMLKAPPSILTVDWIKDNALYSLELSKLKEEYDKEMESETYPKDQLITAIVKIIADNVKESDNRTVKAVEVTIENFHEIATKAGYIKNDREEPEIDPNSVIEVEPDMLKESKSEPSPNVKEHKGKEEVNLTDEFRGKVWDFLKMMN